MAFQYFSGGRSLAVAADSCCGCGCCVEVCPHGVLAVADGRALVVARERCMECGACTRNCAAGAISVEPGVGCAYALLRGSASGGSADCGCRAQQTSGSR